MSAWDAYPAGYRENEINKILAAVRGGDCVAVAGLSGAGKSNLMGFLHQRAGAQAGSDSPTFILVDGNRAQPRTAGGLFRLVGQALGSAPDLPEGSSPTFPWLESAAGQRLKDCPGGLCLLFDRYDALDPAERAQASGPLRALRDAFKYRLTYVIAARRPPDAADELAELFYANTLWLGSLSAEDARWSALQYAARRGLAWDEPTVAKVISASWGYPSLLRACCEACAGGADLDVGALRAHPAVQRRVQEFWADGPSPEDLRRSGLAGQPLLSAAQPTVPAESADLTASEHRLLACLQARPGQVIEKDALIQAVWPAEKIIDGLRDDSLAQLIRRLRQKVEADPANPHHILTVPGRGYRYVP